MTIGTAAVGDPWEKTEQCVRGVVGEMRIKDAVLVPPMA